MMTMELARPLVALAMDREPGCGLSREECRTCSALPAHRRADWRAGRLALKRAAAAALDVPDERLDTVARPGAAPRVEVLDPAGRRRPAPVRVGVTHRDGLAAGVADPRRRVGIDLERSGAVGPEHARYFLSARERDRSRLDPTTLWALKEAAWKAMECDDATPFTALELEFDEGGWVSGIRLRGRRHPAGAAVLSSWPDYVLVIVWIEEDEE